MILIDTNALVVLLVGLIDPKLIQDHRRTSIYDEVDFIELIDAIGTYDQLIVLPNVWTETDNLLNNFTGKYKYHYIQKITELIKSTTEHFLSSLDAAQSDYFYDLGVTDCLLLSYAKQCKLLITSDSNLSDRAIANNIRVFDMVKNKNARLA